MNEQGKSDLEIFGSRHSFKSEPKYGEGTDSVIYPGLSEEKGVPEAKETAKEKIMKIIEQAPKDVIILLGGVSTQERAKSTARVYLDTLEQLVKSRDDIDYVNIQKKWDQMGGLTKTVEQINRVDQNKKIILGFPLKTRGIDNFYYWRNPDGTVRPYADYIYALESLPGGSKINSVREWIRDGGIWKGERHSPSPQEFAEGVMDSVGRWVGFAKKNFPNRPLEIGFTTHSWDLDAFMIYLANNGLVNESGLDKIYKNQDGSYSHYFKENEMFHIKFDQFDDNYDKNNRKRLIGRLMFRNRVYEFNFEKAKNSDKEEFKTTIAAVKSILTDIEEDDNKDWAQSCLSDARIISDKIFAINKNKWEKQKRDEQILELEEKIT